MFLKSHSISLRSVEPSDTNFLFIIENDITNWHVSLTQTPFSKFVLDEFVNLAHNDIYTNKQLRLVIQKNETLEPVGIIDLFEFNPQHARSGLGIFISEKFRNNNFAFESIELIKQYCFDILHLKQIYVDVSENNLASLSLFEKASFYRCGIKKSWNKTALNTFENICLLQCINISE